MKSIPEIGDMFFFLHEDRVVKCVDAIRTVDGEMDAIREKVSKKWINIKYNNGVFVPPRKKWPKKLRDFIDGQSNDLKKDLAVCRDPWRNSKTSFRVFNTRWRSFVYLKTMTDEVGHVYLDTDKTQNPDGSVTHSNTTLISFRHGIFVKVDGKEVELNNCIGLYPE